MIARRRSVERCRRRSCKRGDVITAVNRTPVRTASGSQRRGRRRRRPRAAPQVAAARCSASAATRPRRAGQDQRSDGLLALPARRSGEHPLRLRLAPRDRPAARSTEAAYGGQHLHRRGAGGANPQALDAQARQPPRADRGRDRHRQDGDAAGHRRRVLPRRRALLRRRREGRPVGPRHGRIADRARPTTIFAARAAEIGDTDWAYADNPVQFWDLFGEQGHPIRTTVSEMGPLLLARLMDLNEVQEGVLTIAFHVADEEGLLLLDLDDLQAMLARVRRARRRAHHHLRQCLASSRSARSSARCSSCAARAASISSASPRSTSTTSSTLDDKGRGIVNILAADKLMASPKLYATFLLWLLSRAVRDASRGRRSRQAEARASSSTRRICCSTTRPRRCSTRSSRSCG